MRKIHLKRVILAALVGACIALPAAAVTLNLKAPGRTDVDFDRDAYNKPVELLAFWGIKEGMKVMDLHPGDGYLTLLLGQAVGPKGKVMAFASYSHEDFDKRMKPLAPANVEESVMKYPDCFDAPLDKELATIPDASLDAVLTIRTYHDLKNPAATLAQIKRILKPGGVFGVADSRTAAGRDEENHRIADDVIIREVIGAGFTLAGASQMLSNPKDDYTKGFWVQRFIVDQSCLKFTK